MNRTPVVVATLIAFLPAFATAQFPERVQSGSRVRVWLPESRLQQDQGPWRRQLVRGTVESVSADTMHLSIPGAQGTLAVARQSVLRLDISRGKPSRVETAFERAVALAIVGAITTALNNNPDNEDWPHYSRDWRAAEEGAKWGAAFGAVIGFAFPTERWHRLRLRR